MLKLIEVSLSAKMNYVFDFFYFFIVIIIIHSSHVAVYGAFDLSFP